MSGGNKLVSSEYCDFCKEKSDLLILYFRNLSSGEYNSWLGLGNTISEIVDYIGNLDEEMLKILKKISPMCKTCKGVGIYKNPEIWKEMDKLWKEVDSKLEDMPPEEREEELKNAYIHSLSKTFAKIMLEKLKVE